MTKNKRILAILLVVLISTFAMACSAKNNVLVVSREDSMTGLSVKMTMEGKNDVLEKLHQESVLDLTKIPEEQKAQIKAAIDDAQKTYDAIEGVTYKADLTDNELKEVIEMTLNEKNLKELVDKGLLPVNKGAGEIKQLSIKESKKGLEASGWKVEKYEGEE